MKELKFKKGASFVMDHVDDRIEFVHNGTYWVEVTRSDNA